MNSEFTCLHQQLKIGDAHLANCNLCGAFFPKSGALVIRSKKRYAEMNRMFSSDILRSMYSLCHQKSQRPDENLKISNSYQEVRSLIIDWLSEVSDTLKLGSRSLYHSVSIMDTFLSKQTQNKGVEMEQSIIMLQGLSCLFISAKNYEMDPTVPSSKKFLRQLPGYKPTQQEQRFDNNAYNMNGGDRNTKFNSKKNELCEQEGYILNLIKFDMDTYPLFIDIVEIFLAMGILFTNDKVQPSSSSHTKQLIPNQETIDLCEKYIDVFQLLSLQDPKLINTNHYLIACSICSAARKYCGLQPVWTQELVQLTGLQHTHFCNIEKRLIGKFEQKMSGQKGDLQSSIASSMVSEAAASAQRSEQQRVASRSPQKVEQPPVIQQRPDPNYEQRHEPSYAEIQEKQYKEAIALREKEQQEYQIILERKYSEAAESKYRPLEQNYTQGQEPQLMKNQSQPPVKQQMESTYERLLLQQPNKENVDLNHERERVTQQIANIEIQNSQLTTAERQPIEPIKIEPVMRPIVQQKEEIQNHKLQKSHVFQKLIQNNKTKYDNKIKEESIQTGSTMASNQSSAKKEPISTRPSNVQIGGQLDYEKRQQELRAKYGSNKNKANYYSSKLGMQNKQLGQHNFGSSRASIQKPSGRTSSQSYSQQSASQISRQKSTTSVNSTSRDRTGSGSFSTRLMSGTISSKVKTDSERKKTNSIGTTAGQSRVYTRQMSSLRNQVHGVRAPSVNSTSSMNNGFNSSRQGVVRTASNLNKQSYLQDSAQNSMVRVALKNQRRETKVTGTGFQSGVNKNASRPSQHDTINSQRTTYQRNRVASGVPFLKSQQEGFNGSSQRVANRQSYVGHGSSSNVHLANQQRNSSVMSNNSNNSVNRKIGVASSNLRTKTNTHQREGSATSIRSQDGGMVNGLRNQNHQQTNLRTAQTVTTQPRKQEDFPNKDENEHQKLMAHYSQFQSKITGLRRTDK